MQITFNRLFSIALVACTAAVTRGATYSITLVSAGASGAPAISMGINASGDVTGFTAGPLMQAFTFQNGQGTSLGALGGTVSLGYAINDAGTVAGYFNGSSAYQQGFVSSGGQATPIASSDGDIGVNAINSSGEVAGVRYSSDGITGQGFIYSSGSFQYIGTLPGATGSFANGINEAGEVVGQAEFGPTYDHRAFLYANGSMTDLGTLGGPDSWANAINSSGQAVGAASLSNVVTDTVITRNASHAFLYSGGSMKDLGTLGGYMSQADALNNLGQVVGYSEIIPGKNYQHAFLYSAGTLSDLNTLIDPASGWVLQEATGINDTGLITGNGVYNGQAEAFLLTPEASESVVSTPEPATLGLLIVGVAAMVRRRRIHLPPLASKNNHLLFPQADV